MVSFKEFFKVFRKDEDLELGMIVLNKNLFTGKIMCYVTIILEFVLAISYLAKHNWDLKFAMGSFYFRMYIILIVFMILAYIGMRLVEKSYLFKSVNYMKTLIYAVIEFLLIWSAIISLKDISNNEGAAVYTNTLICIGVFMYLSLDKAMILYTISQIVYTVGVLNLGDSMNDSYPHLVNPFYLYILVIFMSYFKYTNRRNEYISKKELLEKNKELIKISNYDPVTGILNRRKISEQILQRFEECKRLRHELTCFMIDIDFFKKYNDTYGHIQGDKILKITAQMIEKNAAEYDGVVGRFGGEEFLILMSQCETSCIEKTLDSIKKELEDLNIQHESSEISDRLTLSIGVFTDIPDRHCTPEYFVNQADIALYQAKDSGRNGSIIINKRESHKSLKYLI